MSQLQPLSALASSDGSLLAEQAHLRRLLLQQLLDAARSVSSVDQLVLALRAHSDSLLVLGLHDDAARLNAFARAVGADVARLAREAAELEARLVPAQGLAATATSAVSSQ